MTLDDPVMQEEIFGPILPVITFRTLDEAFGIVRQFETPLACYIFAEDKAVQQRVIRELPFGGATVNDVVIHLANNHMGSAAWEIPAWALTTARSASTRSRTTSPRSRKEPGLSCPCASHRSQQNQTAAHAYE